MINKSNNNFKVHIIYKEDNVRGIDLIDFLDLVLLHPGIIGVDAINQAYIKLSKNCFAFRIQHSHSNIVWNEK